MHASSRGRAVRIAALAAALPILAVACGGDGEVAPDADAPSPEAQAETEGLDELGGLSSRWATTPAKIVYLQEVEGDGPGAESTVTLSWRPPDAWRMDVETDGGTTILLRVEGTSHLCSTGTGEATCLRVEGPDEAPTAGPAPLVGLIAEPEALAADIGRRTAEAEVDTSTDTIAGEEARCFRAEAEGVEGGGSAEWCFSQDGLLLRLVAGGGAPEDGTGGYRLEATSVEREVPDADFEPPFPVTEIPDLEIPDVEMPEAEMPGGYPDTLEP